MSTKIQNVRKILSRLLRNNGKRVRLADLSGDTNWRKNHRLTKDGTKPLPYSYDRGINLKQIDIFRTAKELQSEGLIKIEFAKGENWFLPGQKFKTLSEFPDIKSFEHTLSVQYKEEEDSE